MADKNISSARQLGLNVFCGLVVFAVNILTSFFLSPYIVRTLGVAAKGFITLASNFVSYATIVTVALNALSGRFITVKLHQGDYEGANRYYSSVFACNMILLAVLFIPAILCVVFLDRLVNVPENLVFDVKLLFAFVFINFYIGTGVPKWQVACFATNKLHLKYIRDMESNLLKALMTFGMFTLFVPRVYYVGIILCVTTVFVELYSYYYKCRLLPGLKLRRRSVDKTAAKELISSSVWLMTANAGTTLLTGLDLIFANIFIGEDEMGIVSVARVIPLYITDLAILLQNMFMPKLTIFFAKNDDEGLKRELKTGMNLLSVIVSLPLAVMTVFGKEFYTLWQPTIDAELLYILSILASVNMYFTCGVMCVFNLFTVKNKLRPYAVIQLVTGAVSTVAVLILVKFTSLGIYAIAGTSSVCLLLGGIFGSIPYASKLAGEKGSRYYPQMLKSFFNTALICAIGFGVKFIIKSGSWFGLAAGAAVTCAAGFALSFFVLLGKSERREFKTLLGHKFLH